MNIVLAVNHVLKNGATSAWERVKDATILLRGEAALEFKLLPDDEVEKVGLKFGDGIHTWAELPYFTGEPGHSPIVTIENGNWYIDGVDTGYSAVGPRGESGVYVGAEEPTDDSVIWIDEDEDAPVPEFDASNYYTKSEIDNMIGDISSVLDYIIEQQESILSAQESYINGVTT